MLPVLVSAKWYCPEWPQNILTYTFLSSSICPVYRWVSQSVCIFLYPFIDSSIHPSIHPSIRLSVHLSISLPAYLYVYPFVRLSINLSISQSVYLSLCVCLWMPVTCIFSIIAHNMPRESRLKLEKLQKCLFTQNLFELSVLVTKCLNVSLLLSLYGWLVGPQV